MRTDASFRLDPRDVPEVNVDKLNGGSSYIELGVLGDSVTIWGTEAQITTLVAQFQSEHAKRLTQALRVLLKMPDADDLEVQLAASLDEPAGLRLVRRES